MELACQVCAKPCGRAWPCEQCRAIYYCSSAHRATHAWQLGHGGAECERMAAQVARAAVLGAHGLDQWPGQTAQDVCAWLQRLHCHAGAGLLCHCCPLHQQEQADSQQGEQLPAWPALPASQEAWLGAWAPLQPSLVPPWRALSAGEGQACRSWPAYYAARSLASTSPAALALHFVATLWHCLAHLLPERGRPLPPPGSRVAVAYLGPRVELALLPAFAELALLLPGLQLELHLVGPDVPDELHACACSLPGSAGGSLSVSCWCCCWHDAVLDWAYARSEAAAPKQQQQAAGSSAATAPGSWGPASPPAPDAWHLVFAPNAGLPAFAAAWLPTLQELAPPGGSGLEGAPAAARPPVVFSDLCAEAGVKSQEMVAALLGCGFSLAPRLNPFRQPALAAGHGTALPACSNGFLFGWV